MIGVLVFKLYVQLEYAVMHADTSDILIAIKAGQNTTPRMGFADC
jgi:hypothetical protein